MNHDLDQSIAKIRDTMPSLWRAIYQGALQVGFNECVALTLLQTWILSQCPYGIQPGHTAGPESDTK